MQYYWQIKTHVKLTLNPISYIICHYKKPWDKKSISLESLKFSKNQSITNLSLKYYHFFFYEWWKYLTGNFKIHIIIQNSWQLKIIFRPDYTLYSNSKCKNNIQNFKTKSYPICSLNGRQTHTICSFKILWLPRTIPLF